MKRKIAILIVLALIFTSLSGFIPGVKDTVSAAPSMKSMFTSGVVTASNLNVRQGPSVKYPIACIIKKGQSVTVFGKIGDWYTVYVSSNGYIGAVSSAYIKLWTPAASAPKPATPKPTPAATPQGALSQDEQNLLNLVNKARTDAGVKSLAADMNLMKVARLKAKDMVDNNYFSHQSPTYGSPFDMMKEFGIIFNTAGENIAGNSTVDGAFRAWMGSEGHRANILNSKFNFTGIGIVNSPTYGKILVHQFIGR